MRREVSFTVSARIVSAVVVPSPPRLTKVFNQITECALRFDF